MQAPLSRRLMAVGLIVLFSAIAWMIVPSHGLRLTHHPTTSTAAPAPSSSSTAPVLSSTRSTPVEGTHFLFDPYASFSEYLIEAPAGIGTFFISAKSRVIQMAVGVMILITALVFLVRRPETKLESRHRIFLAFGLLVFLGHFAIFNLVWLCSALGDRWSWYFAVIMVPIFFCRFRHNKWVVMLMILLTIGVSGWRLGKLVKAGEVEPLLTNSNEATEYAIHSEYFLTSKPNPIVPAGAIQIEAPLYPWQKTLTGAPPAHAHASVWLIRPGTSQP